MAELVVGEATAANYGRPMRVLVVGAGGVGSALVGIAARRGVFEHIVVADIDLDRASRAAAAAGTARVSATKVDASNQSDLVALATHSKADFVVNVCDPRLNPPIFDAAFEAGCHYLDMAMHLSSPHPTDPYNQVGGGLGDTQFAVSEQWAERGLLALCAMGVEPGFSDVAARYASDNLFSRIDEVSMREYGHQAVVWQTAVHPVAALELVAHGVWQGAGVMGPEAFTANPFMALLPELGAPWVLEER